MRFCCSKGDRVDGDEQPSRPVSIRKSEAEKSIPAVLPSTHTPPAKPNTSSAKPDLWIEAYNGLSKESKDYISLAGTKSTTDVIDNVINQTKMKYSDWKNGGFKIRRKDGNDINVRDTAERILSAALQAKDLIANVAAFDPTGKASAAWTVVSFGLTMVQSDIKRRDAVFAASEFLAETLAYYTLVDTHYRDQKVAGGQNFDRALVRVYTAILNYTAEVNKVQNESLSTRMYHSILAISDHPLQQLKGKIEEERLGAEKWADFTNTLRNREAAQDALNLLDKSLDILKNVNSKVLSDEEYKVLGWVSTAPFSDAQTRAQESRAPDTGNWLLEMKEYKDWKRSPGSVLWLPGIVGCGKSVLCSTVVQDIESLCKEDASMSLAYWYFQFSYDKSQSVDRMMRSFVRQLSRTPLAPSVSKTWEEHSRKGSQPDRKTTMSMLDGVLSSLPGDVYIILDALDECPQKPNHRERESLLSLLVSIAERYKENIHILATSRPEQDISQTMKNFPSINLEQRLAKDVETFVRAQLDGGSLRELDADTKVLVIDTLLLSRERRFRWADLQVKRLEECRTDDHIKEALRTIPDSLEATYQTIIDNIAERDRSIAREILILMCFSAAPLDLQTVADSVSLRSSRHVMDICTTSLLSTSGEEVRLAHFSVKEFLVSEDADGNSCRFSERAAKDHLAKKTVDCISCQTEELNQEMAAKKPFLAYASCHWQAHVAALVDIDPQNADLARKIDRLFTEPTVYFNWSRIADSYAITNDNQWNKLRSECKPALDRATEMGLVGPVDTLVDQGADPLQSWKAMSWCPLKRAALEGRLKIVELLLRKNIPISTELAKSLIGLVKHDVEGEHALEAVLKALLDRGVLQDTARGSSESISEEIVSYAMTNQYSGLLILNIFLDWRDRGLVSVPITGDVMRCAVVFSSPAEEMLDLLFKRSQEEPYISPTMFIDTGGLPMFFDGIAALARRRPANLPLSDALLEGMAIKCDSATMDILLRARHDIKVTEKVLIAAAQNNLGVDMLKLLWPLREPGASITEDVLASAAKSRSSIILEFLIDELGPSIQLTETVMKSIIGNWECGLSMMKTILGDPRVTFEVSEPLISTAASTTQAPLEMLDLLVNNSEAEVHITEDMVCAAAGNINHSSSVLEYLSHLEARPLPVTEEVVMRAVRNPKTLEVLFEKFPNAPITDRVFLGACPYANQMRLLLDKPHGGLPIGKMVEKLSNNYLDSCVVLDILFERNLLTVNEQLVETLAASYGPLNTLLNQRPDAPITEKAVLHAAEDPRSIRLLLDKRPRDVKITEEIMIATTRSGECLEIIKGISHRTGSVPITERLFREAMRYGQVDVVKWMFDQRPDMNITIESLFHEIWQDGSIEWESRLAAWMVLSSHTGESEISTSLLETYPYSAEHKENYDFDEFVHVFEDLEVSESERVAEIVFERCDIPAVEDFLKHRPKLIVTDSLVQAAEKNVIANREAMMSLLEKRKES